MSGFLYSWGSASAGQLGFPASSVSQLPHDFDGFPYSQFPSLVPAVFTAAAGGEDFSVALSPLSTVYVCGSNRCGQLGIDAELPVDREGNPVQDVPRLLTALSQFAVKQVVCGFAHTLALTTDGKVFSWGSNACGELGHWDVHRLQRDDEGLPFLATPQAIESLPAIAFVACGKSHSAAVSAAGVLITWGAAGSGQLGRSSNFLRNEDGDPFSLPQTVTTINCKRIVAVACGSAHTIALSDEGRLYSCGGGEVGQLGLGDVLRLHRDEYGSLCMPIPRAVEGPLTARIVAVYCGDSHSVALSDIGETYTWGAAACGQLGIGDISELPAHPELGAFAALPQSVYMLKHKVAVSAACGENHTLVLTQEGEVFSFGSDYRRQLGNPDFLARSRIQLIPKLVSSLANKKTLAIAAGATHSLAVVQRDSLISQELYGMLQVSEMCDVTIACQKQQIKCHSAVVAGKSHLLDYLLSRGSEFGLRFSHEVISEFLRFCYFEDMEATEIALSHESDEFVVEMMELSHCGECSPLHSICCAQMELRSRTRLERLALGDA